MAQKHGYNTQPLMQLSVRFVDCVIGDAAVEVDWFTHASGDLALLHFKNYKSIGYNGTAVFPADTSGLKQGKYLCRLGFPFPEFTNFEYDSANDAIRWTDTGRQVTPRFPIEGMVTRHLLDPSGATVGFEMSTPGLKGQSGGPAFDIQGKVWGVQFATNHLDLDFDVNQQVVREGTKKIVSDSAFLHVGGCVHVDVMKAFMRKHNVVFTEQ